MRRGMHERVLREHAIFTEHPVDLAARCAGELLFAWFACEPIEEKAISGAVACLETRHSWTDSFHDPCRIRKRDQRQFLPRTVAAPDGEQVAIVKCGCGDAKQHFVGTRTWRRALQKLETVDATGILQLIETHCRILRQPFRGVTRT